MNLVRTPFAHGLRSNPGAATSRERRDSSLEGHFNPEKARGRRADCRPGLLPHSAGTWHRWGCGCSSGCSTSWIVGSCVRCRRMPRWRLGTRARRCSAPLATRRATARDEPFYHGGGSFYRGRMISFAPRLTSLRRAASSTILRNSPSYVRVSPFWERSAVLPPRSRPSRNLPSHSPAASCADSQLNRHRAAAPARKVEAVVAELGAIGKRGGCWLCQKRETTGDNPSGSCGHLFRASRFRRKVGHLFQKRPSKTPFSGIVRPFLGVSALGHLFQAGHKLSINIATPTPPTTRPMTRGMSERMDEFTIV